MTAVDAPSDAELAQILRDTGSVVVLGAHPAPERAGHYVPAYLVEQGYRVIPVNPKHAGESFWGARVRMALEDVAAEGERIDMVDDFRRADALPAHVDELLALRPKVVWLQLGIRHDEVAATLRAAGIQVIQDRCTLADHRRLGLRR